MTVLSEIGPEALNAIVLAAGAVAQADGVACPRERLALLAFLRDRGLLVRHGRSAVLASYEESLGRRQGQHLADAIDELAPLSRLAGTSAALTIAAAARHVAMADGVEWPQETALLAVIADRLGLRSWRDGA